MKTKTAVWSVDEQKSNCCSLSWKLSVWEVEHYCQINHQQVIGWVNNFFFHSQCQRNQRKIQHVAKQHRCTTGGCVYARVVRYHAGCTWLLIPLRMSLHVLFDDSTLRRACVYVPCVCMRVFAIGTTVADSQIFVSTHTHHTLLHCHRCFCYWCYCCHFITVYGMCWCWCAMCILPYDWWRIFLLYSPHPAIFWIYSFNISVNIR